MVAAQLRRMYKDLLKTAGSLHDKNFREYFVRITKDDFRRFARNGKEESDFVEAQQANLESLKRQSVIHNMYYSESFSVKR